MEQRDNQSIHEMIGRYRDTGDNDARDEAWRRCRAYLWAVYHNKRFLGLDEDVDILAWRAFEQAVEAFDPGRDFLKFLAVVFSRRCIDALIAAERQRKREVFETDMEPPPDPDGDDSAPLELFRSSEDEGPAQAVELEEMLAETRRALTQMSDESREAVQWCAQGVSYAKIEQLQGRRRSAKDLIFHDRRQAEKYLREQCHWTL